MEFLGIGYQELLLVLILLLVVVGPERLPGMAYQIGRAVRQMQMYARAVRAEFRDEIDYLDEQYKTIRGGVDEAKQTLRAEQAKFDAEMNQATAPLAELSLTAPGEQKVVPFPAPAIATETPAEPAAAPPGTPPLVF